MKNNLIIMTIMLLIVSGAYSAPLHGQKVQESIIETPQLNIKQDAAMHEISAQIFFRIGKSNIDLDFHGNKAMLDEFTTALKNVLNNHEYMVNSIVVVGTSSPDGLEPLNITLAGARAKALSKYLQQHISLSADKIEIVNGGINWDALKLMIAESKDMPHREEMLKLMEISDPNMRKHKMISYDNGKPWEWMYKNLFEYLRLSTIVKFNYELTPEAKARISAEENARIAAEENARMEEEKARMEAEAKARAEAKAAAEAAQVLPLPQAPTPQANTIKITEKFVPLLAFKTDLLLWAGVMPGFKLGTWTPNLAAEFYFARRWSVQGGYSYANWNSMYGDKELFAVSVGDVELRHWFGKRSKFRGFFLGAFGQYGQYDVQSGVQGNTGSFWSAGLGAGWAQNLSRNWVIELEVRGGYRSANNSLYDIEYDADKKAHYYFNSNSNESKFFPSLKLNIIYRIGKPNKK